MFWFRGSKIKINKQQFIICYILKLLVLMDLMLSNLVPILTKRVVPNEIYIKQLLQSAVIELQPA